MEDEYVFRFCDQINEFILRIGRDARKYKSKNAKLNLTAEEWDLDCKIALARTDKVIEGLYLGVDSSITGGKELFKVPFSFITTSISTVGLPQIWGKPRIIISGNGDEYGATTERWTWGRDDMFKLIRFVIRGEKPLDMHKYIGAAIKANGWILNGIDGFLMLLSKEPDDVPELEEVAFIQSISSKLLWVFPKYRQLEHRGRILKLWDEGYQERIAYFPSVDEI